MSLSEALSELGDQIEWVNDEHGFGFNDDWNDGEKLALIHSEVSELLEAVRAPEPPQSIHIPGFLLQEEEAADIIIRTVHFARKHRMRLAQAIEAKVEYNGTRPLRHGKRF